MSHPIEATRRYVESFLAALKDCGHSPENVRAVLSELLGPDAAERPTPEPPYNEPAFPVCGAAADHQFTGASLRDYFAAKELTRVEYRQLAVCDVPAAYDRLAEHCYRMADAMLKARLS